MRYVQTGKTEYAEDGSILRSGVNAVSGGDEAHLHFIGGAFVPFNSPIDGRYISNGKDLERHNRKHKVINDLDQIHQKTADHQKLHVGSTTAERKAAIRDTMERMQSSGYNHSRS